MDAIQSNSFLSLGQGHAHTSHYITYIIHLFSKKSTPKMNTNRFLFIFLLCLSKKNKKIVKKIFFLKKHLQKNEMYSMI